MTAYLNEVKIIGNVGSKDSRMTSSGKPVVNLSVATDRKFKNNLGQLVTETEWHRVVVFGKNAEYAASDFLPKGRQVLIVGRLSTRKWTDKEGKERYTTEIVATSVQGLGPKPDTAHSEESHSSNGAFDEASEVDTY